MKPTILPGEIQAPAERPETAIATLEITTGIIRVAMQTCPKGEFDFALFVVGDGSTAILKGLRMDDRRFTVHHKRAIMLCLMKAGFERATWDRYKTGPAGPKKHKFTFELYPRKFSSQRLPRSLGEPLEAATA